MVYLIIVAWGTSHKLEVKGPRGPLDFSELHFKLNTDIVRYHFLCLEGWPPHSLDEIFFKSLYFVNSVHPILSKLNTEDLFSFGLMLFYDSKP